MADATPPSRRVDYSTPRVDPMHPTGASSARSHLPPRSQSHCPAPAQGRVSPAPAGPSPNTGASTERSRKSPYRAVGSMYGLKSVPSARQVPGGADPRRGAGPQVFVQGHPSFRSPRQRSGTTNVRPTFADGLGAQSSSVSRSRSHEIQPITSASQESLHNDAKRNSIVSNVESGFSPTPSDGLQRMGSVPPDDTVQRLEEKILSLQRSLNTLHELKTAAEVRASMLDSHNKRLMRKLTDYPVETSAASHVSSARPPGFSPSLAQSDGALATSTSTTTATQSARSPTPPPAGAVAPTTTVATPPTGAGVRKQSATATTTGAMAYGSSIRAGTRKIDDMAKLDQLKLENVALQQKVLMLQNSLNKYKQKERGGGGTTIHGSPNSVASGLPGSPSSGAVTAQTPPPSRGDTGGCTPRTLEEYYAMRTQRDSALNEAEKMRARVSQLEAKNAELQAAAATASPPAPHVKKEVRIAEQPLHESAQLERELDATRERYSVLTEEHKMTQRNLEVLKEKHEAMLAEKKYQERTLNTIREDYSRVIMERMGVQKELDELKKDVAQSLANLTSMYSRVAERQQKQLFGPLVRINSKVIRSVSFREPGSEASPAAGRAGSPLRTAKAAEDFLVNVPTVQGSPPVKDIGATASSVSEAEPEGEVLLPVVENAEFNIDDLELLDVGPVVSRAFSFPKRTDSPPITPREDQYDEDKSARGPPPPSTDYVSLDGLI